MKNRASARALLLIFILCFATSAAAQQVAFPLKYSGNRRHFVDQTGTPFLYHADTGWQIYARLTTAEAREYLTFRKGQGFTTIQTQVSMNPDHANRDGHKPFDGDADFARPNEAYHDHVARIIEMADSLNLLVVMSQPWLGCCAEAYGNRPDKPIQRNGPEKNRAYGSYLGRKFARFKNLFWIIGGDNDPKNDRAGLIAFAEGLRQTAPAHQLLTYHASPPHSSTDLFQYAEWLGFSMVYTYWRQKTADWMNSEQMPEAYEVALREYNKSDVMPFVLGESQYEGFTGNDIGTPHHVRRQAYWTMLSGGAGHAYGSELWSFPAHWRKVMAYPGAEQMRHVHALFSRLPWWTLVPDQRHRVVVAGYGRYTADDYVTTAVTENRKLAVSYLAERRTIAMDMTKLDGRAARAEWFDPRTGAAQAAGEFREPAVRYFTPPTDDDWVLVVRTE